MAPVFPTTLLSFTVVREPLKRFISGYGTIRHRVLLKGKKASHLSSSKVHDPWYSSTREAEIERFKNFVSVVVDEGATLQARNHVKNDCHWNHALSQMWFIELYPQPINFILHVETLEADIDILRRYLPVVLIAYRFLRARPRTKILSRDLHCLDIWSLMSTSRVLHLQFKRSSSI